MSVSFHGPARQAYLTLQREGLVLAGAVAVPQAPPRRPAAAHAQLSESLHARRSIGRRLPFSAPSSAFTRLAGPPHGFFSQAAAAHHAVAVPVGKRPALAAGWDPPGGRTGRGQRAFVLGSVH